MTDPSEDLVRERRGNVLVLRLDRPEARNALTMALMAELGEAIAEAETDPEVRAIVLTGTGGRAFCAGMDLRSFAGGFELLLGCDLIVASTEASFGLPEVKRGLFAAGNAQEGATAFVEKRKPGWKGR